MNSCKCCGALLPGHVDVRLHEIKGQEHAKRAIEVAVAGNHTITLIATDWQIGVAMWLGRWAESHTPGNVRVTSLCRCGGFRIEHWERSGPPCQCTAEQIDAWRERPAFQTAMRADITVEIPRMDAHKLNSDRPGEREEDVLARAMYGRAELAKRDSPLRLESMETLQLMKSAVAQLHLDQPLYDQIVSVAATITVLSGEDRIRPAHLAEALQYRPRTEYLVGVPVEAFYPA